MAPISPPLSQPVLRKRSSSTREDEDGMFEHSSKRQRIEAPQTPPPEDYLKASTSSLKLPDDAPRQLLMRSVALALEHVGFSGASPEALEAMCSEVDSYAENFLSGVTLSMLNCRRSQPTPLDFKYALSRFQLPILSLQPHLKPPIPTAQLHLEFELASPTEEQDTKSLTKLLGDDLSGESEKASRAYIPRRFPAFPSKHTYKLTETESKRETDPRKIREEAAKTARQGEEALRRLTKVSKAGKEKEVENIASRDPKSKERHEMWEKAMRDLMAGNRPATNGIANDDDDRSTIVNSEQVYFRKGVPSKRKAPVVGL